MTLSPSSRIALGIAAIIIAIPLLFIRSDREFSNLTPTAGRTFSVILKKDTQYSQTVKARRTSLTRLGLFFGGTAKHFPKGEVTITTTTGSGHTRTSVIPSNLIDTEGSTQIRFEPTLVTMPGEEIKISLTVSSSLDNAVSIQMRDADGSYDSSSALFTINGEPQELPLAYQLYYSYQPPLAPQMSGILCMVALILLLPKKFIATKWCIPAVYAPVASLLALMPIISLGQFHVLSFLAQTIALSGMYMYLRRSYGVLPSIAGAHVFAFTTWFPLHQLSLGNAYIVMSLLPWLALAWERVRKPTQVLQGVIVVTLAVGVLSLLGIVIPHELVPSDSASLRDIFFDPNQVSSSQKVSGELGWEYFGSYLGFINAVLIVIGVCMGARKHYPLLGVTILLFVIISSPGVVLLSPYALLPLSHLVILITFCLAVWTALGVSALRLFLGAKDIVVTGILTLFLLIALFDLWHVLTGTLEYSFL